MQNGGHEEAINLLNDILDKNPYNFSVLTSRGHAQKTLAELIKQLKVTSLHIKLNQIMVKHIFLYQILRLMHLQKRIR